MQQKIKYDRTLLDQVLERDGASLVDGEAYEKLNRDSRIKFLCKCGAIGEREFRKCYSIECVCEECAKKVKQDKRKQEKKKECKKKEKKKRKRMRTFSIIFKKK